MNRPTVVCVALYCGLLLLPLCAGKEIIVGGESGWRIQSYEDIDARLGDVLVFEYSPFHTVVQVKEKSCDFEGGEELAGTGDSPFRLTLTEPGVFHIACDIPGHCPAGMLFSVNVAEAQPKKSGKRKGGKKKSKKKKNKRKKDKRGGRKKMD